MSQEQIADLLADRLPQMTPQTVRALAALYGASKPLDLYALLDAVPHKNVVHKDVPAFIDARGPSNANIWIVRIRKALGKDAIRTIRLEGYELTPEGRRQVTSLLTRHAGAE